MQAAAGGADLAAAALRLEELLDELDAWASMNVRPETETATIDGLVFALQNIGNAHAEALPSATLDHLFDAATALAAPHSQFRALETALSRSFVLRRVGRSADARASLRAAIETYTGATVLRPTALLALAEWGWRSGDWSESLDLLDRAESELDTGIEMHRLAECWTRGLRGLVLLAMGVPDRARLEFDAESALARRLEAEFAPTDDPLGAYYAGFARDTAAQAIVHGAEYGLATERDEEVIEQLTEVLADEVRFADADGGRARLHLLLGTALGESLWSGSDAGRADRARRSLELAADDLHVTPQEKLSGDIARADLELLLGNLDDAERALDAAALRIAQLAAGPEADSEAALFQQARTAALRGRLARARGDSEEVLTLRRIELDDAAGLLLGSWDAIPYRPGGVGFLNLQVRRLVFVERIELALVGGATPDAVLEEALEADPLGAIARSMDIPRASVADIRAELLGARGGALFYLASRYGSHVFALDRETTVHAPLPNDREIRAAVARLVRQVATDPGTLTDREREERRIAIDTSAREVAGRVLPPTIRARVAQWDEVTIAGAEFLGNPPFAWLPLDGERRLGTELAIAHVPSLAVAAHLARSGEAPRADGALDLSLFVSTTPSPAASERFPSAVPFELGTRELEELVRAYGDGRASSWSGPQASPSTIAGADVASSAVLHVIGHGVLDPERERGACLVLAPEPDGDGLLDASAIEALDVAPLVVLTACSTGAGPARLGDAGAAHLGGAFLRAGARAVVQSSHPVGLECALELMASFHRHLVEEAVSPSEALRLARIDMKGTSCSDPHDHALLRVVGLGHRAVFSTPRAPGRAFPWRWVTAGAVAVVLMGAGARYAARAPRRSA